MVYLSLKTYDVFQSVDEHIEDEFICVDVRNCTSIYSH